PSHIYLARTPHDLSHNPATAESRLKKHPEHQNRNPKKATPHLRPSFHGIDTVGSSERSRGIPGAFSRQVLAGSSRLHITIAKWCRLELSTFARRPTSSAGVRTFVWHFRHTDSYS